MPFPWLPWSGSSNTGRGGRRRTLRAQRRATGEDAAPANAADVQEMVERRQRRIGYGIGGFFLLIIVGVVAFGYYQEFYKPPRVWAGSVRNAEFTMGDLVSRIRVLQGVNRYQGGQVNLSKVPFEYLQNLIHAEILRQQSPVLGINVTDEDITRDLRRQFLPEAEPGQETDPNQLEREFNASYNAFLTATGLSDSDFRIIIEEQLSLRALAALLSQSIEDIQEQAEIQWIQMPLESDILPTDVVRRLENEEFVRVAQELNTPSQFSGPGGYVGWVPRMAFPDLDDAIFGNEEKGLSPLAVGEVSQPIFTTDGNFIVQVISAPEERELSDTMALKVTVELVENWQREALEDGSTQGTVRMNFNSKLYEWVTEQVFITAPRVESRTQ